MHAFKYFNLSFYSEKNSSAKSKWLNAALDGVSDMLFSFGKVQLAATFGMQIIYFGSYFSWQTLLAGIVFCQSGCIILNWLPRCADSITDTIIFLLLFLLAFVDVFVAVFLVIFLVIFVVFITDITT